MNTVGMLWFDNDPKTLLSVKIQKAVDYYKDKYGKSPTLCLVNPGMHDKTEKVGDVTVRPYRSVLPNHLWIGVEK